MSDRALHHGGVVLPVPPCTQYSSQGGVPCRGGCCCGQQRQTPRLCPLLPNRPADARHPPNPLRALTPHSPDDQLSDGAQRFHNSVPVGIIHHWGAQQHAVQVLQLCQAEALVGGGGAKQGAPKAPRRLLLLPPRHVVQQPKPNAVGGVQRRRQSAGSGGGAAEPPLLLRSAALWRACSRAPATHLGQCLAPSPCSSGTCRPKT